MKFGLHMLLSNFTFLECESHQNFPKKEILFQNDFWRTFSAIKNFLFWNVGPIKFPFLAILIAYVINNFLKRQFCFPREKKISPFLLLLHNPSKFPFLELPKTAILLPQNKEIFI